MYVAYYRIHDIFFEHKLELIMCQYLRSLFMNGHEDIKNKAKFNSSFCNFTCHVQVYQYF